MNHPIFQLFLSRLREFYREPEVLFWVYGFPLLLAVGLGIAFWNREPEKPHVDVQQRADEQATADFVDHLQAAGLTVEAHPEDECRLRLRNGKTALFVVPADNGFTYVFDQTRPESVLAHYEVDDAVVRWKTDAEAKVHVSLESVTEPGSRYIDFLVPGLMGLNLMGGGLWGVGFVLVDMRVRKLLKRLLATPMRRNHFLLAILVTRLVLMLPDMLLLFLFGWLVFGVPLHGNLLTLCLVIFVGATAFAGIGLVVGCRTEKTETASGLMNLIMLPMWLLSGTFFSSQRFPDVAQPFIQALPLTQLNSALREVMLEGLGLDRIAWRLAILAAWAVVSFVFALKFFRWQ